MKPIILDSPRGETRYAAAASTIRAEVEERPDRVYAGPRTPWVRVEIPGLVALPGPGAVDSPPLSVPEPTLQPEAETAVAPAPQRHRWLHAMHLDGVGEFLDVLTGPPGPRREGSYLEEARMAREMYRL